MTQELEQINQEMKVLREQMSTALKVVDALSEVQTQFVDLAKTYQAFQTWFDEQSLSVESQSATAINSRIEGIAQELQNLKAPIQALVKDWDSTKEGFSLDQLLTGFRYRLDQLENYVSQQETVLKVMSKGMNQSRSLSMIALTIALVSGGFMATMTLTGLHKSLQTTTPTPQPIATPSNQSNSSVTPSNKSKGK